MLFSKRNYVRYISMFFLILSFVWRQKVYHFVRGYLCAKYPLTNPLEPSQTAVCLIFCMDYIPAIVLRTTSCLCPRTSRMALRHPCLRCFISNPVIMLLLAQNMLLIFHNCFCGLIPQGWYKKDSVFIFFQ